MDWDDLRFVLAVARSGSVAEAARALGVAHSTVYRRITAFEEAHRAKLFERSATGYVATDAARELLEIAESMEQKAVAAERRLQGLERGVAGEVTLTAPEAFGPKLGALLSDFRRAFPEIVLNLELSPTALDLARREADIALRVAATPPGDLVGRRLASIAFAIYGAESETRDPFDAGVHWVVLDRSLAETPQARWETANVPDDRVALRTAARAAFVQAVSSGVGVGILPTGLADQDPKLRRLAEPVAELALPLWILVHPELKDVPRIRAVFDYFARQIEAERALLEGRG